MVNLNINYINITVCKYRFPKITQYVNIQKIDLWPSDMDVCLHDVCLHVAYKYTCDVSHGYKCTCTCVHVYMCTCMHVWA